MEYASLKKFITNNQILVRTRIKNVYYYKLNLLILKAEEM